MKFAGAHGITRSRVPLIAMLALAATIGLAGCEGDDGKDGQDGLPGTPGATGPIGPTGPAGPTGPVAGVEKPLESCAVCHGGNSVASAEQAHAAKLPKLATVSNLVFQAVGPDLVVSYNLKIDGQNATGFTQPLTSDYRYTAGAVTDSGANNPVAGVGAGDYSITIPGGVAAAGAASRYFFRVEDGTTAAVVSGDYVVDPAAAFADVVSDQSCNNCHGPTGIAPHTAFGYPGMTASQCVVCHKATSNPGLFFPLPSAEDSWVGLVHGIHNAHNIPGGKYVFGDTDAEYETTYPTYMTNCSVCHDDTTTLAAANSMPASYEGCLTCHGSMEGFGFPAGNFHLAADETVVCTNCHNAPLLPVTVADFHNGWVSERGGIIWDGVDTSVVEGAKFDWQITGIVDNGTNLAISWTATYDGAPVDPCNATPAPNAPAFHAIPALPPVPPSTNPVNRNNLTMLRSYAQGDDFVLGQDPAAPGQALAVSVTTTNTTCAANVATTTIPVDAGVTGRGIVALQGKPWVVNSYDPAATAPMQVRAKTPTREWVVGTGALPAVQRREIADTDQCLKCHVGSLYQHGGNRVDNVTMCVICHNSASSDQNNRVLMGVDATEAYDGRVGQTYEFKTMLHALHSVANGVLNPAEKPFVIYRTRGIYAWAPEGVTPPNWPATSDPTLVFGGDPAVPEATQAHNLHRTTYPRLANDCAACHGATFPEIPSQTEGVATTLDAGACESDCGTRNAVWRGQLDDTLQGAGTAACTSCHQGGASVGHANQNGWSPTTFPEGRQTIIDAAN